MLAHLSPDRRAGLAETEIDLELGAGEAAQRLSLYEEAVRHKDKALAALGGAIPVGGATVLALLREIGVQLVHRLAPWLAQVNVQVDEAREGDEAVGVDDRRVADGAERADLPDDASLDEQVGKLTDVYAFLLDHLETGD